MQARGLELARFILQVAESVYKHNKNSRSKINHLGWSNGNRSIISMLGSCDAYPKDIVVRLQRVVGSIILWGTFDRHDSGVVDQRLNLKADKTLRRMPLRYIWSA